MLPSALGVLFLAAFGLHQMTGPLDLGAAPTISLDPRQLPDYALQTSLRMAAGMGQARGDSAERRRGCCLIC